MCQNSGGFVEEGRTLPRPHPPWFYDRKLAEVVRKERELLFRSRVEANRQHQDISTKESRESS
jgi:hypothetical protein